MNETVTHINQGQKYRIVIERAASTKGVLGFKVEANGDDMESVLGDIRWMRLQALEIADVANTVDLSEAK